MRAGHPDWMLATIDDLESLVNLKAYACRLSLT